MDASNGLDGSTTTEPLVVTASQDDANAMQTTRPQQNGQASLTVDDRRQHETGPTSPISALPSSELSTRDSSPVQTRLPYNAANSSVTAAEPPRAFSRDVFNSLDFPYSNVALVDFADETPSTSTAIFHFTVDPPKSLEESFFRTRVDEPEEYNAVPDTEFGYHATPEQVEAYRQREIEKAKAREAAIARAEAARLKAEQKMTTKGSRRKSKKTAALVALGGNSIPVEADAASVADSASRQPSPVEDRNATVAAIDSADMPAAAALVRATAMSVPAVAAINVSGESDADDEQDDEDKSMLRAPPMSVTPSATDSVMSAVEAPPPPAVAPAKRQAPTRMLDARLPVKAKTMTATAPSTMSMTTRRSKSHSPDEEKPKAPASQPRRRRQLRKSEPNATASADTNTNANATASADTNTNANAEASGSAGPAPTSVKLKLTGALSNSVPASAAASSSTSSSAPAPAPDPAPTPAPAPVTAPVPAPEPTPEPETDDSEALAAGTYRLHVQDKSCTHPTYARKTPCFLCLARSGERLCRFKGVRTFKMDNNGLIIDAGRIISISQADVPIKIHDKSHFTGPLSEAGANWNRAGIVRPLVRLVGEAVDLMTRSPRVARVPRDPVKSLPCDTCLRATAFARHMCGRCGRIACDKCLEKLAAACRAEVEADTPIALATMRAHYTYDTLRRLRCMATKSKLTFGRDELHSTKDFVLVTTWDRRELKWILGMAKEFIRDGLAPKLEDEELGTNQPDVIVMDAHEDPSIDKATAVWRAFKRERAVVIADQDLSQMSEWTTEAFANNCEEADCEIVNLKSGESGEVQARAFFRNWGHLRRNKGAKLEVYPEACYNNCRKGGLLDKYYSTFPAELKDMLLPNGKANLLAQSPANGPDVATEPRFNFVWAEHNCKDNPANNLQVAHADFVNVVFDAWPKDKCVIKWLVYPPDAADALRPEVQLQTARKLKVNASKYASAHDDALFTGAAYWTRQNTRIAQDKLRIAPYEFTTGLGDVVLIPAGSIFQMTTETDILSMEHYFLTSASVDNVLKVHEEARLQNKTATLSFEDGLRVDLQLLWSWMTAQSRHPLPAPAAESASISMAELDEQTQA
ncbi:hypothetical protein ACM66B_000550 [Microbotryomycetes sp. NB124-2]